MELLSLDSELDDESDDSECRLGILLPPGDCFFTLGGGSFGLLLGEAGRLGRDLVGDKDFLCLGASYSACGGGGGGGGGDTFLDQGSLGKGFLSIFLLSGLCLISFLEVVQGQESEPFY